VLDIDANAAERVASKIVDRGGKALAYACDVAAEQAVRNAIAAVVEDLGEIAGLFNNAGITGELAPWGRKSIAAARRVVDVNIIGPFQVLDAVVPSMQRRGGGAVVNTASTASFKGYGNGASAYVVSKHAIVGLTKDAAAQLAREHIRVNAVAPGVADTPLMHRVHEEMNPEDPEAAKQQLSESIPDGRYATADDVARVVAFLLDHANSHITGVTIPVDGGEIAS
jgi:NAD(P)-dependent dehydrogenase (short-subunit alcohol dehydrogenase family)